MNLRKIFFHPYIKPVQVIKQFENQVRTTLKKIF